MSQTEWVTVYKIYPTEGSRVNYTINIIDTPGFGDAKGIDYDDIIRQQIHHLFSDDSGILYIDAMCFVSKAPDARLTAHQRYIFNKVMSMFGKDIEPNICTLISFADGAKPPVIASLQESKLPFGKTFKFNNSALFAENTRDADISLSQMFWETGTKSFEKFFEHINSLETKSLRQTKDVLKQREELKSIVNCIQPHITAGLSQLLELRKEKTILEKYKSEIKENENFQYTAMENVQKKVGVQPGCHVTNCSICNVTCHGNCHVSDDDKKRACCVMDEKTGLCKVCPLMCSWDKHKSSEYHITYVTFPVTVTYAERKKKFEAAQDKKLTLEQYIEELNDNTRALYEQIKTMMTEMKKCLSDLNEKALQNNPMSEVDYIDLLIETEIRENQPGALMRIKMLKNMKKRSFVTQDFAIFDQQMKEFCDAKDI